MLFGSIGASVGRTPLVELARLGKGLGVRILGKLESRNPTGSVKDRIAVAMLEDAERRGKLEPGGTIVEATSGNTGIALAFAAAHKGYRLIVTLPEVMSKERVQLLKYLGAEVVRTPGALMRAAVERAQELEQEIKGAVILRQFENPMNPETHRQTTAEEIWADTAGAVDVFVAGVGTGGTITGVGSVLKARRPGVAIVAVEPTRAAVLSGRAPSNHAIQGLGAGFVPKVFDRSVVDAIETVEDEEAIEYARELARKEGILAGISSGASLAVAMRIARRSESVGKTIVTMVCDTGERYASTPLMSALGAD